ncbi:uroporphyrinogen-III C-methyltransferase [Halomonas lysinitropha]|uniref:Uroporphyrinogen-III C-methyltransferase n=1 Tax=Halomonas lysinitropha TaxID=2607506 RepID=A0A5K1I5E8_9GAMM|nr:uroporphyrinogen-III C-methyltransferase [Halomonas lysinitropha]VVZ94412.1 Putative uroporphyrinogen-III C-methyltransferase [Halomonas lysinitropha]
MSKQPHEQDEQQAPSGAESASAGGEAGKPSASGRRRSRRYDKTAGKQAADASQGKPDAAEATGESGSGKSSPVAADNSASRPEKGDKPASGSDKPADQKATAEKPGADKPAAGQAASAKPSASSGSADKSGTSTNAGSSAKPGRPGGDKSSAPSDGGGAGGSRGRTAGDSSGDGGKGGGKAGILALVLVILLAIGVVLFGWQAWQKLDAQQQRLASLPGDVASQSDIGELQSDFGELQGQLESAESERDAALDSAISDLRSEFSDYRSSVNETLDQVLDELSREQNADERDWLHAEAAYLLRLANQRLQLERDVEGAAALLRTADERLREADNPALMPVRREIASELAALDSVPQVDRSGLYLALNAQQEQLAGQPLAQDIEEAAAADALEETPSGGWQEQLARFGGELKDLVTVRKHDQALEALISPEQESYLRQSVRLVLEQSQLALLKEEQELYEASLDKALTLIRGYYDTSTSGVQAVIERLEALKQRSIRPELPDISDSQQALATFIERRFEGRDDGQGDDA